MHYYYLLCIETDRLLLVCQKPGRLFTLTDTHTHSLERLNERTYQLLNIHYEFSFHAINLLFFLYGNERNRSLHLNEL